MLNVNNPAVNLETRAFLRGLVHTRHGLDEVAVAQLDRAVRRVMPISPSGWVFLLARGLGAERADALEAASFAELYYAMCSFTDDVQDGDADAYMALGDQRLLVNAAAQLICVTMVRGERFAARLRGGAALASMSRMFLDGAVMLRGQRIELLRERWSVRRYAEVAELSAGRQLDVYFRAAAMAADAPADALLRLSDPMGLLAQVRHDRQSRDDRLFALPQSEVACLVENATRELHLAAREVPEAVRPVVDAMVEFACGSDPV